jgi:hypothetical protein
VYLEITDNKLSEQSYWRNPIDQVGFFPSPYDLSLFDVNGYDLCLLEQEYAKTNSPATEHRYKQAIKKNWMVDLDISVSGCHINHALLFERKGYSGPALQQLVDWSKEIPLVNKLIHINPKWGIDLSIDYVDSSGNVFELFHYEWDSFDYNKVLQTKEKIEHLALSTDWDNKALELINRKDEWSSLPFFKQSDWKCKFYGIQPENFKEIVWSAM